MAASGTAWVGVGEGVREDSRLGVALKTAGAVGVGVQDAAAVWVGGGLAAGVPGSVAFGTNVAVIPR